MNSLTETSSVQDVTHLRLIYAQQVAVIRILLPHAVVSSRHCTRMAELIRKGSLTITVRVKSSQFAHACVVLAQTYDRAQPRGRTSRVVWFQVGRSPAPKIAIQLRVAGTGETGTTRERR